MRFWSWQRARYHRQRRFTAAVALVGYLFTATPLPLPTYIHKAVGRPFPCQHHVCGCATADQCWQSCCCYTPREKLAWAVAHHIQAPAELIVEVAALPAGGVDHHAVSAPRNCCAHSPTSHDHDAHVAQLDTHGATLHDHGKRPCCDNRRDSACQAVDATDGAADERTGAAGCKSDGDGPRAGILIGWMARQCRPLPTLWSASGAVMLPDAALAWRFCWDTREWLSAEGRAFCSVQSAPLLRPPCV